MKPAWGWLAALASALFVSAGAALAEEPEGAWKRYHLAVMAGDHDRMLENMLDRQQAEGRIMRPAAREQAVKAAQFVTPKIYTLERKVLTGADRATLIVSGPRDGSTGRVQVYGTVQLLLENNDWRVYAASWSTERPDILGTRPPEPAPAETKPGGKPAPVYSGGAPVVGSMAAEQKPGSKLGTAKAECVFKPVMTAQDLENCK